MMTYFKSLSWFTFLAAAICCHILQTAIMPIQGQDTEIVGAMYTSSYSSCKNIRNADPHAPSGVYKLRTPYSENVIQVYCEMGLNGGGYTFINSKYLNQLTSEDIAAWFTDKQSFLMRIKKTDGTQPYSVLSQLPQYSGIDLKLGLNEHSLYAGPVNQGLLGTPYLFYGFLPVAYAASHTQQGLRVNGNSLTFGNCDRNPNSHITLFANFRELPPTTYRVDGPVCDRLFTAAYANPSSRKMPVEYFMFTETHWGGCGCYSQTDGRLKQLGVLGSAIGFR